jgi:hypothetical protein
MRRTIYLLLIFLLAHTAYSQAPLSQRIANYDIELSLDVEGKQVYADQEIEWTNRGSAPVSELRFHLYYNAFKNTESTFMQEGALSRGLSEKSLSRCDWGWVEVQSLRDSAGFELIDAGEYIHPDDDNEYDQTVLRVPLKTVVPAGATVRYQMKWHSRIPKIMPRTGYNKDYYFMVQWFPKLGVYEKAGMRYAEEDQWNCHQYHSSGEYYADFGNYDVSIKVPKGYIVGASGELAEKIELADSTTWRYVINDVIDFGWTASPQFVETIEYWKDVEIKLLTYPEHVHCAARYFGAVKAAFAYMDTHIGPYPYPTLTIVDPPIHGLFTGGMEYPTFISSVSFCFLPVGVRTPETLVVHEFIHQYFMQMVATHEVEEPWLDEGFTTYYEGKIMDSYLGEHTSTVDWMGIKIGNEAFNRAEFFNDDKRQIAPSSTMSYKYKDGGYGNIAYNKTALWLNTLEGIVGEKTMGEIMRTYFQRWKFKHPCGQDFFDIVNEIVVKNLGDKYGPNMDWYFDQVHYGTDLCDYAIDRIYNTPSLSPAGYIGNFEDCISTQERSATLESGVVVRRREGMMLPVEVEIFFENGERVLETWDGISPFKTFTYDTNHKIVKAVVDPSKKLPIDMNWINNSYTVEPDKTGLNYYFSELFLATQRVIETLMVLI